MLIDFLYKKILVLYLRKKVLLGMKIFFYIGNIKIEDEG